MPFAVDTDPLYTRSCQAIREAGSDGPYTDVMSLCYERSSEREFNIPEVATLRETKLLAGQTPSSSEPSEDVARG